MHGNTVPIVGCRCKKKTCWPTAQDMNAGAGQSGATPPLRPRVSELQVAEAPLNPPCPRVPQAEALLEPPVPKASPVPEMPQPTPVPEPTPPLPPPSQMVKPEESIPLRFVAEPVGEGGANHGVGLSTQATQETLRLGCTSTSTIKRCRTSWSGANATGPRDTGTPHLRTRASQGKPFGRQCSRPCWRFVARKGCGTQDFWRDPSPSFAVDEARGAEPGRTHS